jgi:hypothetical protein
LRTAIGQGGRHASASDSAHGGGSSSTSSLTLLDDATRADVLTFDEVGSGSICMPALAGAPLRQPRSGRASLALAGIICCRRPWAVSMISSGSTDGSRPRVQLRSRAVFAGADGCCRSSEVSWHAWLMASLLTHDLLGAYEARPRDAGLVIVEILRPGLSDAPRSTPMASSAGPPVLVGVDLDKHGVTGKDGRACHRDRLPACRSLPS